MITSIFLGIALIVFTILFISYKSKYTKLVKLVKELNKPIRRGYYKVECHQTGNFVGTIDYTCVVYVSEIDRFTNGESKISLDNIEIGCGNKLFNKSNAETFIRKEFQSLVETTDITWLESEQSIKDIRKNKLAQLKERMNG